MTNLTERCPTCDQLLPICVCAKPNMSLAEWLGYGRGRGWVSPVVCLLHNLPFTDEERDEIDAGHDPCVLGIRLHTETENPQ